MVPEERTPWSPAEVIQAAYLRGQGLSIVDIAKKIGRTDHALEKQFSKYGIKAVEQPGIEDLEHDHPQILELEKQRARLTEELIATRTKLNATRKTDDIFSALAEQITEETQPLRPLSVGKFVPAKSEEALPCDAVLMLSDEHVDQVITAEGSWGLERFDFNVARARYERLLKLIVGYLTKYLPLHNFERLHVFSLGDGVHGDIHGAGARNHFKNTIKATLALGDLRAQFFEALAQILPVHVVGVSGNHPRRSIKKDYAGGPHDNYDYLANVVAASRLAHRIKEGRVTVDLPNSWTAFAEVRGRVWALNHGDDVVGTWNIPWYGFSRKNARVQAMVRAKDIKISYYAYGHFHTLVKFVDVDSGAVSFHNGAFPLTDPFAQNKINGWSEPSQRLNVQDDRFGVVIPLEIFLRDQELEAKLHKGTWEPDLGRHTILELVEPPKREGFQLIRRGR